MPYYVSIHFSRVDITATVHRILAVYLNDREQTLVHLHNHRCASDALTGTFTCCKRPPQQFRCMQCSPGPGRVPRTLLLLGTELRVWGLSQHPTSAHLGLQANDERHIIFHAMPEHAHAIVLQVPEAAKARVPLAETDMYAGLAGHVCPQVKRMYKDFSHIWLPRSGCWISMQAGCHFLLKRLHGSQDSPVHLCLKHSSTSSQEPLLLPAAP